MRGSVARDLAEWIQCPLNCCAPCCSINQIQSVQHSPGYRVDLRRGLPRVVAHVGKPLHCISSIVKAGEAGLLLPALY